MRGNTDSGENFNTGYIKAYRSIKSHWIYQPERPRTWEEAWIDLLMMASHTNSKKTIGWDLIDIQRGQILTSQEKLSKEWIWDRNSVRNFLRLLEKDSMIILETTSKFTKITICQYARYQESLPTTNQRSTSTTPTTNQQPNTYNNVKNDNNVNNTNSISITPVEQGTEKVVDGVKTAAQKLAEKEQAFLGLFNKLTARKFKTLDSKSKKQFKVLIDKRNTSIEFTKAITAALSEMTKRNSQAYLTPEFITRETEFNKYANMPEPKEQKLTLAV